MGAISFGVGAAPASPPSPPDVAVAVGKVINVIGSNPPPVAVAASVDSVINVTGAKSTLVLILATVVFGNGTEILPVGA